MSQTQTKTGLMLGPEPVGVNQILPHINKWAWDLYLTGMNNHWIPTEVPMQKDITNWKSKTIMTEAQKLLVRRNLGFFASSESLVANNLLLAIHRYITDPEARQYIFRQAFEEAVHNHTLVYICDSLNLVPSEIYEAYSTIPAIKAKDEFLMKVTSDLYRLNFDINTLEGKQEFLQNLIVYYMVCEGLFFYSGFAMLLYFRENNLLPGIGQQIEYTLRDEGVHVTFGSAVINYIKEQNPETWTSDFQQTINNYFTKAVELETAYAKDVLPEPMLGLSWEMFMQYSQHIADRRLLQLGLPQQFPNAKNPFEWLSGTIDLPKETSFFEKRVTNYQSAGFKDDDF